jgi:hypothetical protein
LQRTLEQVVSVLPPDSREGFKSLARQVHAARRTDAARGRQLSRLREYLLTHLTNARYAVPGDAELERMLDDAFDERS